MDLDDLREAIEGVTVEELLFELEQRGHNQLRATLLGVLLVWYEAELEGEEDPEADE